MHRFIVVLSVLFILVSGMGMSMTHAAPNAESSGCAGADRTCLLKQLEQLVPTIDNTAWRDQTYRELAKTYTYDGQLGKALAIIPKVNTADTRAMTIRGIGMAAASLKLQPAQYASLFTSLTAEADKINHPPSQAIAYTYIAMSQAFAGNDTGAWSTAAKMTNGALRNKAYGETAEIQAERGDLKNALISIEKIDTESYRNKAYDTVSQIFTDRGYTNEAYACIGKIDNAYLKAKSIQRILNKGNKEEDTTEPTEDLTKATE